jgi:hypothetical protein
LEPADAAKKTAFSFTNRAKTDFGLVTREDNGTVATSFGGVPGRMSDTLHDQ